MKPIAIVSALSDRKELVKQTLDSIKNNTVVNYKLFTKDGMKDGEMKTVNKLIKEIDFDWTYLVRTDDDMYHSLYWLTEMLSALDRYDDVWLIGGARYPTHKILEERDEIYIMDICPGNHWLIRRDIFEMLGGEFYEDFIPSEAEDKRYCMAIQELGGKVACLKDPTKVVHCGIKNVKGRGRSPYVEGYTQALVDVAGVKTNR